MAPKLSDVTPSRVAGALVSRANYWFIHPVIGTVPRFIWGNDAGFRGNLRGALDRQRGRRAYESANGGPPVSTPEADELGRNGFARIDPQFGPGVVDRVRKSFNELIATDAGSEWMGIGKYREAARQIIAPRKNLDGVREMITPHLRRVLEAHYGSHFEIITTQAWRTVNIAGLDDETAVEAYSNQWHNDRYPTSWVRMFVYLSDGVTRETGAFRAHPIPHTKRIIRSGGYFQRSRILAHAKAALEDESSIFYFEGDAGAACLSNAQLCLHRAGVPRRGYARDMLAFTFRPSTKPLPGDWTRDAVDIFEGNGRAR